MDRSILARSHFIDLSYKTETLVKLPTSSRACLFPYVTVFLCHAFYNAITTNHAVFRDCFLPYQTNQHFQLKWLYCHEIQAVFFNVFSTPQMLLTAFCVPSKEMGEKWLGWISQRSKQEVGFKLTACPSTVTEEAQYSPHRTWRVSW